MTTAADPAFQTRSSSGDLLYEIDDHVATITLNRPDRMNAINGPMLEALSAQLVACQKDTNVRAIILTGAGRGFCAGLDLQEQGERLKHESESDGTSGSFSLFDWRDAPPTVIYRMDKPIICALNGAAAGYGMDMALLCDIRIASENAKMGAVFAKRGVLPERGGTWLLPRLIGWHRAAELVFRGRVLSAQESMEMGLLNKIVPHENLMVEARTWAQEIANNAPLSVQATKRMMRLGWDETFEAAVDHIYLQLLPLLETDDFKEGVSSFLEHREPRFTGR